MLRRTTARYFREGHFQIHPFLAERNHLLFPVARPTGGPPGLSRLVGPLPMCMPGLPRPTVRATIPRLRGPWRAVLIVALPRRIDGWPLAPDVKVVGEFGDARIFGGSNVERVDVGEPICKVRGSGTKGKRRLLPEQTVEDKRAMRA